MTRGVAHGLAAGQALEARWKADCQAPPQTGGPDHHLARPSSFHGSLGRTMTEHSRGGWSSTRGPRIVNSSAVKHAKTHTRGDTF